MSILFPGINYHEALKIAKLPTLSIRRDLLCKTFFMHVSKPESKLNYLLEKRNEHSYDLRHNQIYKIEIPRTERYKKKFYNAFTSTLYLSCVSTSILLL